jgi:hypothetical protein
MGVRDRVLVGVRVESLDASRVAHGVTVSGRPGLGLLGQYDRLAVGAAPTIERRADHHAGAARVEKDIV